MKKILLLVAFFAMITACFTSCSPKSGCYSTYNSGKKNVKMVGY